MNGVRLSYDHVLKEYVIDNYRIDRTNRSIVDFGGIININTTESKITITRDTSTRIISKNEIKEEPVYILVYDNELDFILNQLKLFLT